MFALGAYRNDPMRKYHWPVTVPQVTGSQSVEHSFLLWQAKVNPTGAYI